MKLYNINHKQSFKAKALDLSFLIYALIFGLGLPILSLFVFRGAEELGNILNFLLYVGILVGILAIIVYSRFTKYGEKSALNVILHDPERGALSRFIPLLRSPLFVFLTGLVIAFTAGLYSTITGNFLFGVIKYQVAPLGVVFLAGEPTALVETLFQSVLIGTAWGVSRLITHKYFRGNGALFWGFFIVLSALSIPVMTIMHSAVYGASEVNMFRVGVLFFIFWLMFVAFGTFIIVYLTHFLNNILNMAKQVFSSDLVLGIIWILYIIIIILYIYYIIYLVKLRKPQKRRLYA